MARTDLTAQQARDLLNYNPDTGTLTWKGRGWRCGQAAGGRGAHPYVRITIGGAAYLGHRLAWLIHHGFWPASGLDHIDGDPSNNRICNLRDVPHQVNAQNRRRPASINKSGFLGVHWSSKDRKWAASIGVLGKTKWLGLFSSPEEAHVAYLDAKRDTHRGCTL